MIQTYTNLDDLWCEWSDATDAIMKHIENNERFANGNCWSFEKGVISKSDNQNYSVHITFSAYDPAVNSLVQLHVSASVMEPDSITIKNIKREKLNEANGFLTIHSIRPS